MDGKQLQQQYKDHISDYKDWDQREHAAEWLLYSENTGVHLSIDETSLSNGELYTIVTNKAAQGRKGSLVAMVKGTQASSVIEVLRKIPKRIRGKVREVTLDMAANMGVIVSRCFSKASKVIDRFHVQKLVYDAVQEIRIQHRWQALDQENRAIEAARQAGLVYQPEILANGDTLKQLLVRSRTCSSSTMISGPRPRFSVPGCFSSVTRLSSRLTGLQQA